MSSRRLTLGVLLYPWSVSRVFRSAKTRGISEDARILAKRQILESRIRVFDTMPRAVRDQCAGFKVRHRSNHGFRGCNNYFDLHFPYRFWPDSIPL